MNLRLLECLLLWGLAWVSATYSLAQPPLAKNGTDFSNSELVATAKNLDSIDQGLTAEWLLAMREHAQHGEIARRFKKAVELRTGAEVPEWWVRGLTIYLDGLAPVPEKKSFPTELKFSRRIGFLSSDLILLPASFQEHHKVFGTQLDDIRVITAIGKQQEPLPLLIFHKMIGAADWQHPLEISAKKWNPALDAKTPFGFAPESLADPSVSFVRIDNHLVIFIDVGCLPSLCIFDLKDSRPLLSFVPVRSDELACINCKGEDLRPTTFGG